MLLFILLLILLILMIPTAYAATIGAPIAVTSKNGIRKIAEKLKLKPGDNFYELGAGTGRVMIGIAKASNAKVIGFELSPIFYWITLINLKINKVKNYKLYFKNFFTVDLNEADAVFCFLMPKTLEKIKKKFQTELKPGTRIISYAFAINGWAPFAVIKEDRELPIYFYEIQ